MGAWPFESSKMCMLRVFEVIEVFVSLNVFSDDENEPETLSECRETLLHFAGRLGLHETALFLLTKPGSEEALSVINHEGQLPCAVAADQGFDHIAELFSG